MKQTFESQNLFKFVLCSVVTMAAEKLFLVFSIKQTICKTWAATDKMSGVNIL
jgi:hypothetical protein